MLNQQSSRPAMVQAKQPIIGEQSLAHRPEFSVIICTYNRRNSILSTLASLRRQTLAYAHFEIIVIDNASTDQTFQALQSYLSTDALPKKPGEETWQVHCLREQRNGLAYARNTALQIAIGAIAVFIDDDTFVEPHFLEHLLTAYAETCADAIGGRVEARFEGSRPYWLSDNLLEMLGYFAPFQTSTPLPTTMSFGSSNFSVKIAALQQVGAFIPFLSKRRSAPMNMEVAELCQRLHKGGYSLWYEPAVEVVHRVPVARLQRAFLVGRAYWKGRSEILTDYASLEYHEPVAQGSLIARLGAILPEYYAATRIALWHRPLLWLAARSTNERLLAVMEQAHLWGRIKQQILLINHVPILQSKPAVLLVHAQEPDSTLLARGLLAQGVHCTTSNNIPLHWLWQHRTYQGRSIGLVHLYRPGAFTLNFWQRHKLLQRLWLARFLGIQVLSTDAGGWWHNMRGWQILARRAFERKLLLWSNAILVYTRQPEQIYSEKSLRQRAQGLAYPGLRGTISPPVIREQAYAQFGLPRFADFVYLCLAYLHTEHEILHLIEAFGDLQAHLRQKTDSPIRKPQLLLIGAPGDKKHPVKVFKRAALNSSIHLCMTHAQTDMPLYIGAANALVMPHFALKWAGMIDIAMLFYSYERIIIAPDLPRFHNMLPPHAGILYNPSNRATLVQALWTALTSTYQHAEHEAAALAAEESWYQHAGDLLELYQPLLKRQTKV